MPLVRLHLLKLSIIFMMLLPSSIARTQPMISPNIELISQKNGFPFNVSNFIVQDKRGFIWIGGPEEVARYDGYSFITLPHNSSAPYSSMPNKGVTSMAVDRSGMIWIGQISGYISRLDPVTFAFWTGRIKGAEDGVVNRIFCDRSGTLWCAVPGNGLYKFDGKSEFDFVCALSDLPRNGISPPSIYNVITDFYEDENNNLWLASPNGLYTFDRSNKSLKHISSIGNPNLPIGILQFLPDGASGFWCATWSSGVLHYDLQTDKFETYKYQKGLLGTTNIIYKMARKSDNELWVSAESFGLGIFNTDTKKFTWYLDELFSEGPIYGDLFVGRYGIVWALSYKGLHKWDIEKNQFMFYKIDVTHSDNHNYYYPNCILDDTRNGRMIIGMSYADGLHVIHSNGREKIIPIPFHPLAEHSQIVNDLIEDTHGNIYVVTRDYLFLLTKDDKLKKVGEINSLLPPQVTPFLFRMLQAQNGDLWLLSSRIGLFHQSAKTKQWEYLKSNSPYSEIDSKTLRILEDNDHRIWLMNSKSITVYDPLHKTWLEYKHEPKNPNSLRSTWPTEMIKAPNGDIFIATVEGISKFEWRTKSFTSKGLPNYYIHSMTLDNDGALWAVTYKGLLYIDQNTGQAEAFSSNDGLNGIYTNFTLKKPIKHGKMYVLAVRGYYEFDPVKVKQSRPRQAPVFITAIRDLNTNQTKYNPSAQILMSYKNSSVSIEFAAINFLSPLKNRYQYKMEGLDQDWIETSNNVVNYSGIPSGSFTFRVQLIGAPTQQEEASIKIEVTTPFWNQLWFRAMLVTIAFAVVYFIYRIRLTQVRAEEKIKRDYNKRLAEVEMKALKAQMNPHFIFNSLNSINRYIVKSEPENASLYLTKFSKLIRLILDNSNQKIISLESEINALKLYIELEALRFNKKFAYTLTIGKGLNPILVGVPPLLIQPFVENAIWHGLLHKGEPGSLEIEIDRYGNGLRCTITDNGVGRKKAAELQSKEMNKQKSYGMRITSDRLGMMNGGVTASAVEIHDLEDAHGNALGTKVIIKILSAELETEF